MFATKPITTLIETVSYEAAGRCFAVSLSNGCELRVPVDLLTMEVWEDGQLKTAPRPTNEQLSEVRVWSGGRSIDIDRIKQSFGLEQLLRAMAAERRER